MKQEKGIIVRTAVDAQLRGTYLSDRDERRLLELRKQAIEAQADPDILEYIDARLELDKPNISQVIAEINAILEVNPKLERHVCVDCRFHRNSNPYPDDEDKNDIWYNQECTKKTERSYGDGYGTAKHANAQRFPNCRDINPDGLCPDFSPKYRNKP